MRRLVLVLACLIALPRAAHADLAGSVYEDVRDVIEELIRSEVTTSVVRTIETKSPALAFYLHGTLERLASPYWGSLGRTLEADLTVVVSDFVYWHLSSASAPADIASSAKQFFACVAHTAGPDASDACRRLDAAVEGQHRPLLEVECRRAKPPPGRRVACDIGLATLAALEHRTAVRHHVIDALADIVLAEIDDRALHDRLADLLASWLDHPDGIPTGLLDAIGDPDLEGKLTDGALAKLCADPHTIDDLLHDANSAGWVCFAVSYSTLPGALGAQIAIRDGDHELDAHLDYWNIETALKDFNAQAASDDSSFRLLADMAFDSRCPAGSAIQGWPCKGTRLAPGATVTVEWLGRQIAGTVGSDGLITTKPSRQMMLWLLRFRRAVKHVEDLRALVPPSLQQYLFYPGSAAPESRSVLRSVARMARLAAELRARWYLWTQSSGGTSELDVVELLHAARDALGPALAGDASGGGKAKHAVLAALGFLDRHPTGGGGSSLDIGDWLRLVMRGDYRSLAMESLRAALDLRLGDSSRPRETFFLTLAAYLLDAGEGVDETVARSAFKAAAKDLLEATTRTGVPGAAHRVRLSAMPRVALRLSYSEDYAALGGDTRRTVVTAEWPTAMLALSDYVGLEGSLLDPIAPLSELALRPAGTYHDESYVALDLLRPRLGLWIAVPALSRRLTLSAGVAARFVHLAREPGSAPPAVVGRYSEQASLVFDAGVQLVF